MSLFGKIFPAKDVYVQNQNKYSQSEKFENLGLSQILYLVSELLFTTHGIMLLGIEQEMVPNVLYFSFAVRCKYS